MKGVLVKMSVDYNEPIEYTLKLASGDVKMNNLIGSSIAIAHEGYQCLGCSKNKKVYRQGHCYDCFYKLPSVADWVIKPELSKAHLGIEDRDLEYEKNVQLKPHIVYLAMSSNSKVGVTRKTQTPTRWIDQGASFALPILETPNRYLAGIAEVALKSHLSDKTNWRRMLKNEVGQDSLLDIKSQILEYIPKETQQYILPDDDVLEFNYPVEKYPQKIKSLNLTKTPQYQGVLVGIKGQYLIFEDETVFNIRSNEGLVVELSV